MTINIKQLTLSIGIIGTCYACFANAKDYAPINGGITRLNDGDRVIFNDPNDDTHIIGINLNSPDDSITVNGAATIDIRAGKSPTGVFVANGAYADLGSGSIINMNDEYINDEYINDSKGLNIQDQHSSVKADNLTINSKGTAINIVDGGSAYLTGTTVLSAKDSHIRVTLSDQVSNDVTSSLIIDKLVADLDVDDLWITGSSSEKETVLVDLGTNSSINMNKPHAHSPKTYFQVAQGARLKMNQATLKDTNFYIKDGSSVDFGSGTQIINGSKSDIIAIGRGSRLVADHLNISFADGIWDSNSSLIEDNSIADIGAGSHYESLGWGWDIRNNSTFNFKGSETERNTIFMNLGNAIALSQGGIVNIENTDITLSSIVLDEESYFNKPLVIGLMFNQDYTENEDVQNTANLKNSSILVPEGSYAIMIEGSGTVNMNGKTVINAGANKGSAFYMSEYELNYWNDTLKKEINVKDQAIINGNIFAKGDNTVFNFDTTRGAILTGYTEIDTEEPGAKINIRPTDGIWNMTDNSQVTNLVLNNSTVKFLKSDSYATLSTETLAGANGVFKMRTDLVTKQGDQLVVNGRAEGTHKIQVTNHGSSATNGTETFTLVKTQENKANFSLANKVELGAYVYDLRKVAESPNDIELYSSGKKNTTTTAQAAGSFLNIGYLTNYIENQTLLQRLGDLRNHNQSMELNNDGFWIKGFGGKLSSFSGAALNKFDMSYIGTQLGIDKQIIVGKGQFIVGAMTGFTHTNPNYREGNGNGKNYIVGLYGTYLLDDGLYVDSVLKYNSMKNYFSVKDTEYVDIKGTGKTQGISLSVEIGKKFWISSANQGIYFEPQAQLSYGYQSGDTVDASNGLKVKLSHYNSTLGRLSSIFGYQVRGENPINIYLKTGVVREMSGGSSYRFNNGSKNSYSFRSNWFDTGIGGNININKCHNIYGEIDYSTGNHFNNTELSVGYRYSF